MINQFISNSRAMSTGPDTSREKPTFELDKASKEQITLEWIQSLSPEVKDTALYRLLKIVEAKPTLCELFSLNQVIYRILSGNTFTESATSVAQRTGCDRKTILKGLAITVEQNILEEKLRPGTSNEYFFKPVEEWNPEPLIHKKDTPKIIQFPSTGNLEAPVETVAVQNLDDPILDLNTHVVSKLINKQQVSVPISDTPTIWRSLPDGNRYAQIPPIYDQAVGVEIQRQIDESGLTAQSVVGRAIAFSKVPLLVLEVLAGVGSRLLDACSQTESELFKGEVCSREDSLEQTSREGKSKSEDVEVVVSLQLSKTLIAMGVILTSEQMHQSLTEYGEDAMLDAAVQLRKSGVLVSQEDKEGCFLNYLQNAKSAGRKLPSGELCAVRGLAVEVKQREVVTPKKPSMTAIKSVETGKAATFPDVIMQMLKNADIYLVPTKAEKLWAAHSAE